MGKPLSPLVKKELANLDKDPRKNRVSLSALKSFVEQMDTQTVPLFLAEVSDSIDPRPYAISLYEVLARNQGKNIVVHISKIMDSIIKALSCGGESVPLQRACARVVMSVVTHGMIPLKNKAQQEGVLRALCNPLLDALMARSQPLADGVALCLQNLVESEGWKFAAEDMVNELCWRVTCSLKERATWTSAHMNLAACVARFNGKILQQYVTSLAKTGVSILENGVNSSDWKHDLTAVKFLISLLKYCGSGLKRSEVISVSEILERYSFDATASVKPAILEALKVVNKLLTATSSPRFRFRSNKSPSPGMVVTPSFKSKAKRKIWDDLGDLCCSNKAQQSESQESFAFSFTPFSATACSSAISQSPINWPHSVEEFNVRDSKDRVRFDGGVDISLKDGLLPLNSVEPQSDIDSVESSTDLVRYSDCNASVDFRFLNEDGSEMLSDGTGSTLSENISNQNSLTIEDYNILATPRKLIRSLQQESSSESASIKARDEDDSEEADSNLADNTSFGNNRSEIEETNEIAAMSNLEAASSTNSPGSDSETKGCIVLEETPQDRMAQWSFGQMVESVSSNIKKASFADPFITPQHLSNKLSADFNEEIHDEPAKSSDQLVSKLNFYSGPQEPSAHPLRRLTRRNITLWALRVLFASIIVLFVVMWLMEQQSYGEDDYYGMVPT